MNSFRPLAALATLALSLVPDQATAADYVQDFTFPNGTTDLGDGTSLLGNANFTPSVQGGRLHLTTNTNSNNSAFHIPAIPDASCGFTVSFDYELADDAGGNPPADGLSFSYGAIPFATNSAQPEEGWPGVAEVLSFEIDTWQINTPEVGPAIGLNRPANVSGLGSSLHSSSLAFTNGNILLDGESRTGTVTITVQPGVVQFTTTGLITNANFINIPTPGFTADEAHTFALAARTGGANVDLFIDNLVITCVPLDSDGDGMPDCFELAYGLPIADDGTLLPGLGPAADLDGDGLTNLEEFQRGSSPLDSDTDEDGLSDLVETNSGTFASPDDTGTNPADPDTDADGLPDAVEDPTLPFLNASQPGTDPNNPNTDGDSLDDLLEATIPGRDPTVADDPLPSNSYAQDFDGFPAGFTELGDGSLIGGSQPGIASVQGGQLRLTANSIGSTISSYRIPALLDSSRGWTATFDFTLSASGIPADGFSFCYGAIPPLDPLAPGFSPEGHGAGEEGWGAIDHISFEVDTWEAAASNERGLNIASNLGGVQSAPDHAFTQGTVLNDASSQSGSATVFWDPYTGAGFTTTGLLTNAAFTHIPVPDFTANDEYRFAFSARTGGITETVLIDNVVITPGAPDTDGDGLTDGYEMAFGLDPNDDGSNDPDNGGTGDPDNEGLDNLGEQARGTNPFNPDSDGDGLSDLVEDNTGTFLNPASTGTDPLTPDTDSDGLLDNVENPSLPFINLLQPGTDPHSPNTDSDSLGDRIEILIGRDPTVPDDPGPSDTYAQNFNGYPDDVTVLGDWTTIASSVAGLASTQGNRLRLTTDLGPATLASFRIPALLNSSKGWTATFDFTIEDIADGSNPADGFTFSYGAIPPFDPLAPINDPAGHGLAEEGWGAVDHISFEVDTWDNFVGEAGVGIASNLNGVQRDPDHAFNPGLPLAEGTTVNGTATISWDRFSGATFFTSGLLVNADFISIPIPGFTASDDYIFAFNARTAGAWETLHIDNILITPGAPDADGDGLSDGFEEIFGLDPRDPNGNNGGAGDPDGDGLSNLEEQELGTDPTNGDTDGDGLLDGVETGTGIYLSPGNTGTSPFNRDTDDDGLNDNIENPTLPFLDLTQPGTDPNNPNTDGDNLPDRTEITIGRDPTVFDNPGPSTIYVQNFDGYPKGATFLGDRSTIASDPAGSAHVRVDALLLTTDGVNSTSSSFRIPALLNSSQGWTATFEFAIADRARGGDPADGFNFSYGAIPQFDPLAPASEPAGHGLAEEGWGPVDHISFEIDTWDDTGLERGVGIASNLGGAQRSPDHAFLPGIILTDNSTVTGTATLSWHPVDGASFSTTGLLTNANFANVPIPGFTGADDYVFAIGARTAGLSETVLIDNIVITTGTGLDLDIAASGTDLVLTWNSRSGKVYDIRSSADLSGTPELWQKLEIAGLEITDLPTTPPLNTFAFPRPADPERFFVVVERSAPPLFADDFEADLGWTARSFSPGTRWLRGEPTSGPGSGANRSLNCYGTNIFGNYANNADAQLVSPIIDLTDPALSGAILRYQQSLDTADAFDFGTIQAFDTSGVPLGPPIAPRVTGVLRRWAPVSLNLPPETIGKLIRLRFTFESNSAGVAPGWYIDDVEVLGR